MSKASEALSRAVQQHQAGDFVQAEAGYRKILQLDPGNVDALYLLGLVALHLGRNDSAVDGISQALNLKPGKKSANRKTLRQLPVALQPEAHHHLATAFGRLGKLEEAVASWREALRLKPGYAEAQNNLGITLQQQGKLDEAAAAYQEILRQNPGYAGVHFNLAIVLREQGKLAPAEASYRQALAILPNYAEAFHNLGDVLKKQRKLDEAVDSYRRALELKPDHVDTHFNLGDALLLQGNWPQGWTDYEHRRRFKHHPIRPFAQPEWQGESLAGKTILLHTEQGLGDTLQFIRYGALLKKLGARVVLLCQRPLLPLLATCPTVDQIVRDGDPLPEFDVQLPLLSVPRVVQTTLETIPADIPYLFADAALQRHWRDRLSKLNGTRIGIAWQGSPTFGDDRARSIPIVNFAPLAQLPGVRLISLQKGLGSEQLPTCGFPVMDLEAELDVTAGAFMDTAAIMMNLDLVLTSDTAIAHLAGALGVPVWVALTFVPEWRWLLDREDSPWYPTMRLFRQTEMGNWQPVFQRMAAAVQPLST